MHDMQERMLYLLDNYIGEKLKRETQNIEEIKQITDQTSEKNNILDQNFAISPVVSIFVI